MVLNFDLYLFSSEEEFGTGSSSHDYDTESGKILETFGEKLSDKLSENLGKKEHSCNTSS